MLPVVVASPDYLARRGVPQTPANLKHHDCLRYNFRPSIWSLRDPLSGAQMPQPVRGPFSGSDGTILREVCLAGSGLMWTGDAVVAEDLCSGLIVEVLTGWMPDAAEEISAVFAGHAHLASRVTDLVDFLSEQIG